MEMPQSNLDELMKNPNAAALLKNPAALKALLNAPDTQKLMQMLTQKAGGGLKSAASAAAKGDTRALNDLVGQVMNSQEGAQVIQRIQQNIPKQPHK
jgi:hypothetical protein